MLGARPLSSYSKVQRLIGAFRRNLPAQVSARKLAERPLLNLGCGWNAAPGFVNLDYLWRPGVDLCWDLAKPLPFGDQMFEGAFSEHCLEHLNREVARRALRETRRVLRPGAIFRVVLPDAGLYARLYAKAAGGESVDFPYPTPPGWTPMAWLNSVMRDHGHLYGYDAATISSDLREAGFEDVRQEAFGQGRDPCLLIDSPERACESLYVEGTAPSH